MDPTTLTVVGMLGAAVLVIGAAVAGWVARGPEVERWRSLADAATGEHLRSEAARESDKAKFREIQESHERATESLQDQIRHMAKRLADLGDADASLEWLPELFAPDPAGGISPEPPG